MTAVKLEDKDSITTSKAIKYLFDNVKYQFENSIRQAAYDRYPKKFKKFCQRYLRSRGRSGSMLVLSDA